MQKSIFVIGLTIMITNVWGANNNPCENIGRIQYYYFRKVQKPKQIFTEHAELNCTDSVNQKRMFMRSQDQMRKQISINLPDYNTRRWTQIMAIAFSKLSFQEIQAFFFGFRKLPKEQRLIVLQQVAKYGRIDYDLYLLATVALERQQNPTISGKVYQLSQIVEEALKRDQLMEQKQVINQTHYQSSQIAEKNTTSQDEQILKKNIERYGCVVNKYMQSDCKDDDAFQKSVQFFRNIGLTDKKIAYNLNYFEKIADSREDLARSYLNLTFGIQLDMNGNKNAQDETIAILGSQGKYRLYNSKLLGIKYNYSLSKKGVFPKKGNIEFEISFILNKYESTKRKNLQAAVIEAANNLYYKIGFPAYRIIELLELPYKVHDYREVDVERKFSRRSKNLRNKDRARIKNTRREGVLYFLREAGEEIWQIADFFGVKRKEIHKYIAGFAHSKVKCNR